MKMEEEEREKRELKRRKNVTPGTMFVKEPAQTPQRTK
jgi:hypothetical protein